MRSTVERFFDGIDIATGFSTEICAESLFVTAEATLPGSAARQTEIVRIVISVGEVDDHDGFVPRPAIGPASECDHLVAVIDVKDFDVSARQAFGGMVLIPS